MPSNTLYNNLIQKFLNSPRTWKKFCIDIYRGVRWCFQRHLKVEFFGRYILGKPSQRMVTSFHIIRFQVEPEKWKTILHFFWFERVRLRYTGQQAAQFSSLYKRQRHHSSFVWELRLRASYSSEYWECYDKALGACDWFSDCLTKLARLRYSGPNSIVIRLLLNMKYSLPARAITESCQKLISFTIVERALPEHRARSLSV